MAPRLTHIALHVRDLDATVAFYERFVHLEVVHRRHDAHSRVAWMAEKGRSHELILVLVSGGPKRSVDGPDYAHLGFAAETREAVDAIAALAREAGCLEWPTREEPYPVGYYCGLRDPDGTVVEISYGQPLGAGAEDLDEARVGLRIRP